MECQYLSPGKDRERVRVMIMHVACLAPTGGNVLGAHPCSHCPITMERSMWVYELSDPKCIKKEPTMWGRPAHVFYFHQLLEPLANRGNYLTHVFLTFHHILLVVTIIVAVRGSVIDIKAMDWGVVVTCWNILQGRKKKQVDNGAEKSSCDRNHWGMEILPWPRV